MDMKYHLLLINYQKSHHFNLKKIKYVKFHEKLSLHVQKLKNQNFIFLY